MSSKVETLAVCCESGTVSVTRSFESTELGACLAVTLLCSLCLQFFFFFFITILRKMQGYNNSNMLTDNCTLSKRDLYDCNKGSSKNHNYVFEGGGSSISQ